MWEQSPRMVCREAETGYICAQSWWQSRGDCLSQWQAGERHSIQGICPEHVKQPAILVAYKCHHLHVLPWSPYARALIFTSCKCIRQVFQGSPDVWQWMEDACFWLIQWYIKPLSVCIKVTSHFFIALAFSLLMGKVLRQTWCPHHLPLSIEFGWQVQFPVQLAAESASPFPLYCSATELKGISGCSSSHSRPWPRTVLPQNEAGGQLSLGRNACGLDIWGASFLNHCPELGIYGGTVTWLPVHVLKWKLCPNSARLESKRSKFDS